MYNSGFTLIIVLVVAIGLFFLLRELWCWYLKINALLEECQRTSKLISDTNNLLSEILTTLRVDGVNTNNNQNSSVNTELNRYKEYLANGAITQEEYEKKKSELSNTII